MSNTKAMVAERRNYSVKTADEAKQIVIAFLDDTELKVFDLSFGLPEINDRYDTCKVPVIYKKEAVGDIVINAFLEMKLMILAVYIA